MQAPLLALTRQPTAEVPVASARQAAGDNMRQLIQLRWLAVTGQLVAILFTAFGLGVALPLGPMLLVVGLLALANLVFLLTLRRWVVPGELFLALLLDLSALTAQLYLSGGTDNPFVSLYLLQVVLGAILLPRRMAWMLIGLAVLCFAFLSQNHLPLALPRELGGAAVNLRLIGEGVSFAMVATLLALFIGRISRNLRAQEKYLADLRQRAAEEDGIVRMGLFASGAAHELGTPLSSLSVLVADWMKSPGLRDDPALQEELTEANAAIERCKDIVTNILHSAGTDRGEAMRSEPADRLLEEIVSDWEALHGSVALAYEPVGIDEVRIAAEPALRQALFNLLDNAAEVSPLGVKVRAEVEDERLAITVMDWGPGFPPEQLRELGRLYQSSKGTGHGVGLFLVANVARRLGGTLEASNRVGGGAAVRLLLPLTSRKKHD